MTQAARGPIAAVVTHARHVPETERHRFARQLRDRLTGGALVLETCHRVEGYVICPDDPARLTSAVALPAGGRLLIGEAAVRHAIAVAVGRDSVVVGEDQVLHQLRGSVGGRWGEGGLDPVIGRLFAIALRAGRRARSWRQGPQRSLADLAIAEIERQSGSLGDRDVLVVGAGKMGRLVVRAAAAAGASVSIANRSAERGRALAAQTGAGVEPFDPGARTGVFAGLVVALGGPWRVGPATTAALARSTTVVVDLSVPAAVPPTLAEALGGRFVSADALAVIDPEAVAHEDRWLSRLDALIDDATAEFVEWLKARDGRAAAQALIEHADREREAELAALWQRLPDLGPEAHEAIDAMTRHLTTRLLRAPLERLGRDSDGSGERFVRDLFAL